MVVGERRALGACTLETNGERRRGSRLPQRPRRRPRRAEQSLVLAEANNGLAFSQKLSVTSNPKYQKPFLPLIPGVKVGQLNDTAALEGLVGEKTCAVIVEPIQGEGGINAADVEWLRALRKRCDEVGAVLIFDEIQCGLYRTGNLWAHSSVPADGHPDIVTTAKPLANGYPIGAVLMRDNIAEVMTAGTHGTTFGGSPLACALGYHVLSRLSDKAVVASLKETSDYLEKRLSLLTQWFPDNVGGKPWFDGSKSAMRDFAKAQDTWAATWPSDANDRAFRM
ncbi:hypothetical protein NUW54_g8718 [Trametes sanguinea]|uniref:Uncharacterized protein n=1 Tax=Trametes sanguinea TaxID=158606 RepID=A0ACC1PCI6_9APHY|nr:hypothetical protein NUW54_g8718 [Trametes sanguinea]